MRGPVNAISKSVSAAAAMTMRKMRNRRERGMDPLIRGLKPRGFTRTNRAVLFVVLIVCCIVLSFRAHASFLFEDETPCEKTIELPNPSGPSEVGLTTFFWIDESRPETATTDPNDRRQVIADIWYPGVGTRAAKRAPHASARRESGNRS